MGQLITAGAKTGLACSKLCYGTVNLSLRSTSTCAKYLGKIDLRTGSREILSTDEQFTRDLEYKRTVHERS
ncbi:hypothetical protein J6590_068037 [Homalodisca vitripennis]|nr:hypothetical protein J6590_068037 [Homalodisca vitripennis]